MATTESVDQRGRVARVNAALAEAGLDALLVTRPENFAYLSGFMAFDRAGWLVVGPNVQHLFTTANYAENAQKAAIGFQIEGSFSMRFLDKLAPFIEPLRAAGVRRLGFEATDLSVWQHDQLAAGLAPEITLVKTEGLVEPLRAFKTEAEIASIQAAVRIADAAFERLLGWLKPTMTEREAAWGLERDMRDLGADGIAFEVIVAAGSHAAIGHHRWSDRKLGVGQPIVIDFGARVHGYDSDCTRTLCFGQPDDHYTNVWRVVAEANETARAGFRPGMTCHDADALARDVLGRWQWADKMPHGLGHGIGLAIHEAPWLKDGFPSTIEVGNVFTVEPAAYFPGWGGVRIEDIGVLRANGFETFTRAPKPVTL